MNGTFLFVLANCDADNGGCNQLCIPMPEELRVCTCTYGYRLVNDTKCVTGQQYSMII